MDNEDILFENKLINHFYRWDCPNSFDLGDYILKLCSSESGLRIQSHLNHCLLCRKEIENLKDLLEKSIYPLDKESIFKRHSKLTHFTLNTHRPEKDADTGLKRAARGDHEFLKELEIRIKHRDKEEMINLFFKIEPFDGEYRINIHLDFIFTLLSFFYLKICVLGQNPVYQLMLLHPGGKQLAVSE